MFDFFIYIYAMLMIQGRKKGIEIFYYKALALAMQWYVII